MSYKAGPKDTADNQAAIEALISEAMQYAQGGQIRIISPLVSGKEITLAHVIGTSDYSVYKNLGLDIGFHAGVVPEGDIGILHCSPWETTLIACDIAMKMGTVDIGFMDRFSGCVIITGKRADVISALEEITRFFREVLNIRACAVTHD